MRITMSLKDSNACNLEALGWTCMSPIMEPLRGKSPTVKTEVYAALNENQKVLFMFYAFYNHAKNSLAEYYWWSAYYMAQPALWTELKERLQGFGAEGMLELLTETEMVLLQRGGPQNMEEFQVSPTDLDNDPKLVTSMSGLFTGLQAIAPDTLRRIGTYVHQHVNDFIELEKEGYMELEFPTMETERVVLRPLTLDDSEQVFAHFADPSVTEFMDIEPCKSIDDAKEIVQFHIDDTGCRWGLFDKHSGRLLGTCGYHCWTPGEVSKAEIGFDLTKAYWGKGYMTEVLRPVIDFGFKEMALRVIEATVEPGNARSMGLLRKLGFVERGQQADGLILFTLVSR